MFEPVVIAPSILSADFLHLGRDVALVKDAGAGFIHVDVMDGHFVPNLTIGIPHVQQLAREVDIPLDVHLMIDNPLVELPWFLEAGADFLSVHAEVLSEDEMRQAIELIHASGAKASFALKPQTDPCVIQPIIDQLDMVLVMSVEPGFSGQSYIAKSERKVARVVELAQRAGVSPLIEVDGGIGAETAALVAQEGADVLVCGNAVFGADDPASALQEIKMTARKAANHLHDLS